MNNQLMAELHEQEQTNYTKLTQSSPQIYVNIRSDVIPVRPQEENIFCGEIATT